MIKLITFLSLSLFVLIVFPNTVLAACNPPECGYYIGSDLQKCSSPDVCSAKCCVAPIVNPPPPPPDGGGGGGGGTTYNPQGSHDVSNCSLTGGWACDMSDSTQSINVDLYVNGPVGTGTYLGTTTTGSSRPDVPAAGFCGANQNTGFNFITPNSVKTGTNQTIYAYGMNIGTGSNALIGGSPKTINCAPACVVDLLPATSTTNIGSNISMQASITSSVGTISAVNFSSANSAVASVSPASDTTSSYTTTLTGVAQGTTTITANVLIGGVQSCTDTATVNVLFGNAWWRVKDGNVRTNGNIRSLVPSTKTLINATGESNHGLPIYGGTFNLSSTPLYISAGQWSANTQTVDPKVFDYNYFEGAIPDDIVFNNANTMSTAKPTQYGYEWFDTSADLVINSAIDFGNRKVILFVRQGHQLHINNNIYVNDSAGLFAAFVSGDINVAASVTLNPSIEGLYLTNGQFSDGAGSTEFRLRGSLASFGGIKLERSLSTNSTTPAEYFMYGPDQVVFFPEKLGFSRQKWVEVAP